MIEANAASETRYRGPQRDRRMTQERLLVLRHGEKDDRLRRTLGTHPLHYMGSMVYAYPPHVRKYEIIGGLFGEPYRLARCGVADLEVSAGAEIIIEGEILPNVHEPEGPFSEFTGYASYRSTQNVFVVNRIRMRLDAMFQSVTSGMSRDHILISCITISQMPTGRYNRRQNDDCTRVLTMEIRS